jgi:hypothetical protein
MRLATPANLVDPEGGVADPNGLLPLNACEAKSEVLLRPWDPHLADRSGVPVYGRFDPLLTRQPGVVDCHRR